MAAWHRRTIALRGACVVLAAFCLALAVHAAPRNPRFANLSVDEGLPQENVTAVLQDRQGFVWLGTQAGLARYDGYRFVVHRSDPSDPGSLADNYVTALVEDPQGRLFVGTRGGLHRYDAARDRFERLDPKIPGSRGLGSREIRALLGPRPGSRPDDSDHALWVATADGLLRHDLASGAFRAWHADEADGPASDDLRALAWGPGGRLWIGMTAGLDRFAPASGRFEHHALDAGALALLAARDGRLWVGTRTGLQAWSAAGAPQPADPADEGPRGEVASLAEDRDATIWAGARSEGLFRLEATARRWQLFRHAASDPNSPASDTPVALYQDRGGVLWIGTTTGGASTLDLGGGGFERYRSVAGDPATLPDSKVYGLASDGAGGVWVGTIAGGLAHLDPARGVVDRAYRHVPGDTRSLPHDRVNAILRDTRGGVWVGTNAGLVRLDPATGRFEPQPLSDDDPALNQIYSLLIDNGGALWVGAEGGLHRVAGDRAVTTFRHDPRDPHSIAQGRVTSLVEDRRGTLWAGTATGLERVEDRGARFTHFTHDARDPASLSHDRVIDLFEDHAGTLWVSTARGVNRLERGPDGKVAFRAYTTREGLAADPIGSVREDARGLLWISSNGGLSRLDPATGAVRNFSARDGLNRGSFYVGSSCVGADGTLYFGGVDGITAFRPESIRENQEPPPVVLTGLKVLNRAVAGPARPAGVVLDGAIETARTLELGHGVPAFALEFAALHFADPSRNRYAHQLVGFDPDWVVTGADERVATYTNLAPGHYVFRVKASNKDGVWNETPATLAIVITPPLWGTWWFRAAALALLVAIVVIAHRVRVRALTSRQAWLTREVDARTQEVVRQKEQLEQGQRDLSLLGAIGREITAKLDERAVCETLDRHVHALLDAAAFAVYVLAPDAPALVSVWLVEDGAAPAGGDRIALDSPTRHGARCVRERRELLIDVAPEQEDPSHVPGTLRTLSSLFAPLSIGERVIGLMTIQSPRRHAYGEREQLVFRTLCAYGAIALDNAAVYRRLAETDATLMRTMHEQDLIFDHAAAAIFFVKNRVVERCNRGLEEMLGYGPGELIGQSTQVYHASRESWEALGRAVYPLVTAGKVAEGEWELMRKDGARIWTQYRGRALDPNDLDLGSIWVVHDISERKKTAAALERALREQQFLFDNELGCNAFAKDRVVVRCNRGLEIILGYDPGELTGQSTRVFFDDERDWLAFGAKVMPVLAAGGIARGDVEYVRKDGRKLWLAYSGKAMDAANLSEGVLWVAQEITERKHGELALREGKLEVERALEKVERTQRQLALLSELTGFLQACTSAEEAHACIAEYAPRLFPAGLGALYALDEDGAGLAEAARWGAWADGGAHGFGASDCWALRRGQPYRVDTPQSAPLCPHVAGRGSAPQPYACVPLIAQGRTFGLLFVEHASADDAAHGIVVALAEQIGLALANIRLREALTQQSIRDPLTGLYNRRYLHDVLGRELARCRRDGLALSALMIDVDHFKRFNDTFGHHAGDLVLQGVGRLVEARCRGLGVGCRFGGEEFVVLLPGRAIEQAHLFAIELLDAIRAVELSHDGRALDRVTASLGLAQFPLHGDNATALIAAADAALYAAKLAGRNRVVLAPPGAVEA